MNTSESMPPCPSQTYPTDEACGNQLEPGLEKRFWLIAVVPLTLIGPRNSAENSSHHTTLVDQLQARSISILPL
ncbi:hypothetical protein TNCT_423671 [Trichonephila clavata]|uniref:Uncharacterized protein n=1 Tax=Trichonephila clavata TaxID=2740835 RepID=A0A8X6I003_TRICU|nr:hypothetical protein TNCT_423671 [Trichonephila clavata]